MGKIQIMPVELSNKISAGEVVERPSNIVKELVENSIDAGSKNISIYLNIIAQKSPICAEMAIFYVKIG